VSAAKAHFGGINVLLNNAGIGRDAPITEMPFETWRLQVSVNLEGMFLGMKHAIPLIRTAPGGSVVSISSAASIKATPNMSAYCASKAGVRMLTKVAALENARATHAVRVNSVHPGTIETPAWKALGRVAGQGAERSPDLEAYVRATLPLGIVGQPSDIANAVLFLVSDESRFITGAELFVDGGRSIS
jgi:NAD(P)-dependent dehydrogenase (short-subunit alcohol dehydrogenase family)